MRTQIWSLLCDCKFKSYYMGHMVTKYQKYDRNLNIFLAIASSGSIAAWAIWSIYPMLWGIIIAASQVLSVIKPYLPFFKYVKELNLKLVRIESLNIDFEKLWFKIQRSKISEDDSVEEYFILQKQLTEILNFSDESLFEFDKNIKIKADRQMKVFLKTKYNIEIVVPI
jgi:hypothetical protein